MKKKRNMIQAFLISVLLAVVFFPFPAQQPAEEAQPSVTGGVPAFRFASVVREVYAAQDGEESEREPVYGSQVADGEYEIEVESSSSMFRVTEAVLTVKDGEMSALMTLGGTGYGRLFMGTAEEAASADESLYIPFAEDEEGAYTYSVPVEALNRPLDCAAWSIRKEKWYDRKIVFQASSLPEGAVQEIRAGQETERTSESPADGDDAADTRHSGEESAAFASADAVTDAPDGVYRLEVSLQGGSGRTSVSSPAEVSVKDGKAVARIEWSSPHYDYMTVDGKRYLPVNEEGNSVFEIPVCALDEAFEVTADTTAMGTPHEIEYTLIFDSAGLEAGKNGIPAAVAAAILIAVAAAAAAGIFIGRRIGRNRKKTEQTGGKDI